MNWILREQQVMPPIRIPDILFLDCFVSTRNDGSDEASLRGLRNNGSDEASLRGLRNNGSDEASLRGPIGTKQSRGFTLVELVIGMTIISFGLMGVILAFMISSKYSADPMVVHQAVAIAESYMDEITQKSFPGSLPCPNTPGADRTVYSSICDYNGLNQVPTDQNNNPIAGLGAYNVVVNIDSTAAALGSLPVSQVVRIDVTISRTDMQAMTFSEYRTNY